MNLQRCGDRVARGGLRIRLDCRRLALPDPHDPKTTLRNLDGPAANSYEGVVIAFRQTDALKIEQKSTFMKRKAATGDWLPLARGEAPADEIPTGEVFRPEWIDFERGLRVGNLEPHERITRILKHHLEQTYATPFVTDRWGRGVYWQWICWLPRANREAKPLSHDVNFGCAKLFIATARNPDVFKSGLQIERGYAAGPEPYPGCLLRKDWDWNRLMKQCAAGTPLDAELNRLLKREGFVVEVWQLGSQRRVHGEDFQVSPPNPRRGQRLLGAGMVGFQLYYPMPAPSFAPAPATNWSKPSVASSPSTPGDECLHAGAAYAGQPRISTASGAKMPDGSGNDTGPLLPACNSKAEHGDILRLLSSTGGGTLMTWAAARRT